MLSREGQLKAVCIAFTSWPHYGTIQSAALSAVLSCTGPKLPSVVSLAEGEPADGTTAIVAETCAIAGCSIMELTAQHGISIACAGEGTMTGQIAGAVQQP